LTKSLKYAKKKSMEGKIKTISAVIIILFILSFILSTNVEARSGCCSWHGGVCTYKCPDGINTGYKCCDGSSLSAKCAPYYSTCPLYIRGCTDPKAINYSARATTDNGSCKYPKPEPLSSEVLTEEEEPEPEPESVLEPESEYKPNYQTAQANDTQSSSSSWIWWVIVIGLVGLVGYNYGKKRNKK